MSSKILHAFLFMNNHTLFISKFFITNSTICAFFIHVLSNIFYQLMYHCKYQTTNMLFCSWKFFVANIWNKILNEKAYQNCSWWELFKCEICDKIFERKYKLRKHLKIVHYDNFSYVRFVIKYFKENMNWESILQLFMMGTFQM